MTHITISDVAQAAHALDQEIQRVEQEQLRVASALYQLMRRQAVLSTRFKALNETLTQLVKVT